MGDKSKLAERMLAATSKPAAKDAMLVLEDGSAFRGKACGAAGEVFGEICFNTAVEGYLEVISDPSYAGQIVAMTYPQIGNYGVCLTDAQSERPALRGLVVRDLCRTPSNWRSDMDLATYLEDEGVVAIEGIDTRALVRLVRERGAMRAVVSTEDLDVASLLAKVQDSEPLVGVNLVKTVSCAEAYPFGSAGSAEGEGAATARDAGGVVPTAGDAAAGAPTAGAQTAGAPTAGTKDKSFALTPAAPARHRVVAYDCGAKRSILQELVRVGCDVTVVPWNMPADEVLAMAPDGVFVSNGPGDPDAVQETYAQVGKLLGNVPLFGICMGHQMICKAAGAQMEKLRYGHHGANHPVMNLLAGRVEITSQNHGFNLVFPSLGPIVPELSGGSAEHADDLRYWVDRDQVPVVANDRFGRIRLTHVNLNDGTAEGIAFADIPAFSVQYHPEASPGPTDSHYLFTAFVRLMDGRDDYLDIDIAKDRLEGWRF